MVDSTHPVFTIGQTNGDIIGYTEDVSKIGVWTLFYQICLVDYPDIPCVELDPLMRAYWTIVDACAQPNFDIYISQTAITVDYDSYMFDNSVIMTQSGFVPEYSSASGVFTSGKPDACPLTYTCTRVGTDASCEYTDNASTSVGFDELTGQLSFMSSDQFNAGYPAGTTH